MRFTVGRAEVYVSFGLMAAAAVVAVWDGALFCYVLTAVALHEGAHFAALGLCGAGVRSVRAGLTGVVVEKRDTRRGGGLIAAAGPAANLLAAAFWKFWPDGALAQLAVGVYHLLPLPDSDGGELLRLGLIRIVPPQLVERMLKSVAVAVSLLVFAGCIVVFAAGLCHFLLPLAAAGLLFRACRG